MLELDLLLIEPLSNQSKNHHLDRRFRAAIAMGMTVRRLLLSLVLAAAVVVLAGCGSAEGQYPLSSPTAVSPIVPSLPSISELAGTPAPEIPPLPALDPEEIALGQEVYTINCASCHGQDLEGKPEWQTQNEDD